MKDLILFSGHLMNSEGPNDLFCPALQFSAWYNPVMKGMVGYVCKSGIMSAKEARSTGQ